MSLNRVLKKPMVSIGKALLRKSLYILPLLSTAAMAAPSTTMTNCLKKIQGSNPEQEKVIRIQVDQLLADIAPSRRSAAKPEFIELKSCFALNDSESRAAIISHSKKQSTETLLNSRLRVAYITRAALTERQLTLLSRYGILSSAGIEGRTLQQVLYTHRLRTAKIIRQGKFFHAGANFTANVPSLLKKFWSSLNPILPAYAQEDPTVVLHYDPEAMCDGKAYWKNSLVYIHRNVHESIYNTVDFKFTDKCYGNPNPTVDVDLASLRYDRWERGAETENIHFITFKNAGFRWVEGYKLFMGISSHLDFCQTAPPKLDKFGNALPGEKPQCAFSRYKVDQKQIPWFEELIPQPKEGERSPYFAVSRLGIWLPNYDREPNITEIKYQNTEPVK